MSGFAKGADVSWITEMEQNGKKFYNANGKATECMALLRDLGMNSIRLRVWVNPEGGWCGKDDVIAKAWRAQQLGFRLMIDFHYSDTWADPGNQKVPAAWQGYTAEQMKQAVADHTKDVLKALKDRGVTNVEWVQVGNETRDGMLFNSDEAVTGQVSKNAANFAAYVNAGYDAVKAVYPQAKVIVHVDEGNNLGRYTWLFGELKKKGVRPVIWADYGFVQFANSKKEITKPEDFAGLKLRGYGELPSETIKALGASPVTMGSGEVYMAIQRGVVDGQTSGTTAMYDRKMFEVTKYLTITNHAYPEFILAMNEKSFQKLTPEQQKIVTDAANEVRDELRKNAKAEDMAALEKLKEKGMQVYVVPEAELPAWQSATKPVWDIFVKHTGDLGKELIEICSKQ